MRILLSLSAVAVSLLLGLSARADPVEAQVPDGTFRFWQPSAGVATWISAGVRIRIEPAPCRTPPQTEGCSFDHVNNQPLVTVTAPGLPEYRTLGDSQSSFYRIAVARLQPGDSRPGIVLENQSGGSGGDVREQILFPEGTGYREQFLPVHLQGELPARLSDLSGDGAVDFVLGDGSFDGAFGCNACTPRPPRVLSFRNGAVVDVSREHAYAGVFQRALPGLRDRCFDRHQRYRNGSCAAYVATAARLGQAATAWTAMLRHYNREGIDIWRGCVAAAPRGNTGADQPCYRTFPQSLAAFLRKTEYMR